jgi:diaminopimelate decarboxylase
MAEGRKQGHDMEILDVGGGFPSGPISQNLYNCLSKVKDDPLGYKVIAEPGRHVSNNTCHLLFRVLARRRKAGKLCYHVNESLYHSFNCNLMDGVTFE